MAKFYTTNTAIDSGVPQNVTTTYRSMLVVSALGPNFKKGKVYELSVGANGIASSTQCFTTFDLSRFVGLFDAVAHNAILNHLDPDESNDSANTYVISAEGTTSPVMANSSVWNAVIDQRANQTWTAASGHELVWPVGSTAGGFVMSAKSTNYSNQVFVRKYFEI